MFMEGMTKMLTEDEIRKIDDTHNWQTTEGRTAAYRDIEAAVLAKVGEDTERLNWILKHPDATICRDGPRGPYHIWFQVSNRVTDEQPTARAAIDAARGKK